jgi:plastocyanin
MQANKKNILIVIGVVVVIAVVVIAAIQTKKVGLSTSTVKTPTQTVNPATTTPDEIAPSKNVVSTATVTPEVLQAAVQIASGTDLITKDNQVVTPQGVPVKLNVLPSSLAAPQESAPIAKANVAIIAKAANAVNISISAAGFVPNTFTVKAGQLVNFILTSTDDFTHVFLFDDSSLMGSALGVAGHETRTKSWNAPAKGTYTFHCDLPGHAARGEVGKMIVE